MSWDIIIFLKKCLQSVFKGIRKCIWWNFKWKNGKWNYAWNNISKFWKRLKNKGLKEPGKQWAPLGCAPAALWTCSRFKQLSMYYFWVGGTLWIFWDLSSLTGLNPGNSTERLESQPLGHQGTPNMYYFHKMEKELSSCRFDPWVQKIHWRREWLSTPVFLPGECYGQRSLAGYSLWGCKESDTTEWLILSLSVFLHSCHQKSSTCMCMAEFLCYSPETITALLSAMLGCNGTPLQYSCLENPMDGGAW